MSTLYVILGVVIASIIAIATFVVVGAIEHKKHININWVIFMIAIILACSLAMMLIYHSQHDLTSEDIQASYNEGYEDGKAAEHHTIPTNKEMEEWFSKTEKVVVGSNGNDTAVHIIDGQGEEWVLYVDETINK